MTFRNDDSSKFPLPKVDVVSKFLFGTPRNAHLLQAFLSAVLKKPVKKLEIRHFNDTHLEPHRVNDKNPIVDVKATLMDGTEIHIEVQLHFHKYLLERVTFYNAKIVSSQLARGENYGELRKVITILLSNDELFRESPAYHHTFSLYDPVHQVKLTNMVEFHTLEFNKVPEESDGSDLHHWMSFFKSESREELLMAASKDEMIAKAYEELERLGQDREAMLAYERRLIEIRDKDAIRETALEEGEANNKLRNAENLLDILDDETIADKIGLPLEIVQELRKLAELK